MRIAILSPIAWRTPPKHYGPWEQMASNLAEGLVNKGFDVTLFATKNSITSGKLDGVIDDGYEEDRQVDAKVAECLHISNLMEKASKFDLIHNHFDFLPLSYSRLIKTPLITTIHGFSSPKIIPVYKKYNSNTHYVSISNSDRSTELNYLATVYNGINVADFKFNNHPEDYLVYFGRIHPDKGTAEAIEIAQKSKRNLIISGLIQDGNYFKEKVEPFLNEQIKYVGNSDPVGRNNILGKAAALLHPINFNEPFGLSIAEAMMCGTPVIAFNKGSMSELIKDQETGFLVNTVDEALEALQNLHKIKRENCRKWSQSQFSRNKMVSDYIDCYNQILAD
ncbi:glycosyltransferase family 4 protein [Daejeonella oryzae]|uniref:glycosyltransferase family 4 protein n=1 Tax=Daejeonella oryzae TaxID=1122943 RepID=UPI000402508B|nr:glycosyltransferase family 4 protein [Daejeonella oryzae]